MAPGRCGLVSPAGAWRAPVGPAGWGGGSSRRRRAPSLSWGLLWWGVVVMVYLQQHPGGVGAEPLHHSRTYKDEYGLEPPRRVFGVKTFEQGLEYLVKYGWVNCSLNLNSFQNVYSDTLLKADPNARAHEGVSPKPLCTEDEVQKGYLAMQQYYKLPETGTLDDNTLRLMNNKRCGNRDAGNEKKEETPEPKPKGTSRVRRAALLEIERLKALEEKEKRARDWSNSHGSVILGRLLSQTKVNRASSIIRRQQILEDYKQEYHQEDILLRKRRSIADIIFRSVRDRVSEEADLYERAAKQREKRSAIITLNGAQPEVFKKGRDECVTWRIPGNCFSSRIPAAEQRSIVRLAFRMWSEVIPLCFTEQRLGPILKVDIQICFAKDYHHPCEIRFDGSGGELAHSWKLGDIHFDDSENYRTMGSGGINLLKVAVHEIGHVLGLNHTQRNYSVMYSIYIGVPIQTDFELGWEDRKEVQKYYGVCKGRFDTVFDWIRLSVTQGLIYNTYFFRRSRYWMYENRFNRTRYGDPLVITNEWKGVPGGVDAYTQVILWDADVYRWKIETYFFKGDKFYIFDSDRDKVQRGMLISDYFGPKNDSSEAIPSNLDSVFFDIHSQKLQFFKGEWVYIYDPAAGSNRCCEHKAKFTDFYPTPEGKELSGNVDAVYYSHTQRKQYFFKDEDVWINEGTAAANSHRLRFMKEWYGIWFDICDVGDGSPKQATKGKQLTATTLVPS